MSINVPLTVWQPTTGNGEMSSRAALNFVTKSGNFLVTKTNLFLITGTSTFTQIPSTVWAENDGV